MCSDISLDIAVRHVDLTGQDIGSVLARNCAERIGIFCKRIGFFPVCGVGLAENLNRCQAVDGIDCRGIRHTRDIDLRITSPFVLGFGIDHIERNRIALICFFVRSVCLVIFFNIGSLINHHPAGKQAIGRRRRCNGRYRIRFQVICCIAMTIAVNGEFRTVVNHDKRKLFPACRKRLRLNQLRVFVAAKYADISRRTMMVTFRRQTNDQSCSPIFIYLGLHLFDVFLHIRCQNRMIIRMIRILFASLALILGIDITPADLAEAAAGLIQVCIRLKKLPFQLHIKRLRCCRGHWQQRDYQHKRQQKRYHSSFHKYSPPIFYRGLSSAGTAEEKRG